MPTKKNKKRRVQPTPNLIADTVGLTSLEDSDANSHTNVTERDSLPLMLSNKKFIPLRKVITFFTLDILLPKEKQFTPQDFERFLQSNDLENEIDHWMKQYHPPVDQSLEGDIYSQNQKRNRSIIEEISNSIDAHPDAIQCTIKDGYYEIREINGIGMSPEIVCTKYLPPKATTKNNSEKQIGRFGIGSFTKLAHLNNDQAYIIVETRAPGQIGIRIEYKLIDGLLMMTMQADNSIQSIGTVTKVCSSEIVAKDYEAILKENIGDDLKVPVTINGQSFVPDDNKHQASICINNIRIQRTIQSVESFTTKVIFDLPHGTTISESRNKIILDSDEIRDVIRHRIETLCQLDYPDWVLYANTIAPLIAEIQTTNNSLLAKDNVFDYLLQITHKKLGTSACVPDNELYKPLVVNNIIPLHESLLPADWIKRVTTLAPDFDQHVTKIYLADLINYSQDIPFIFDKDRSCIFVDKNYYQKIKNDHNLGLLELIFKYPKGEIHTHLTYGNDATKKTQTDNVVYKDTLTKNPFHTLYKKHGLLWLYGEEVTRRILDANPDAGKILDEAKSLIALYPVHEHINYLESEYRWDVGHPLLAVRFNGQRFYFDIANMNDDLCLYDANFQLLHDAKWQLLKAKIQQYFSQHYNESDAYTLDLDISINENDIFVVPNKLGDSQLVNGKGEVIDDHLKSRVSITPIDDKHYVLRKYIDFGKGEYYFVHKDKGIVNKLSNKIVYHWKKIPNSSFIAGEDNKEIINLFDMNTNKFVLEHCGKILQNNNYLLGINQRNLTLMSLTGEIVYEINQTFSREIMYFVCEGSNDHYNLSMIDERGEVHFIQIDKTAKGFTHQYFDSTQTIGYPVSAIISTDKFNNVHLKRVGIDKDHIQDNVKTTFKFIKPYANKSETNYSSDDKYSKIKLERLYRPNPVPVFFEQQDALLDPDTLAIVPLQQPVNKKKTNSIYEFFVHYFKGQSLDWSKVREIYKQNDHYYIEIKDKENTNTTEKAFVLFNSRNDKVKFVFDASGKHIASGKDVRIYKTSQCYVVQKDGEVLLPNGIQLQVPPVSYLEIIAGAKGEDLVGVAYKTDGYYQLYDLKGNQLYQDKQISFMSVYDKERETEYYSLNFKNPDQYWLYTPYGQIEHGRLHGSNCHPDPEADDLIVTGYGRYNQLLTRAGYPFFNEEVPEFYVLLRNHVGVLNTTDKLPFKTIFSPLSKEQLTNPDVLNNLAYLNKLNLDTYTYSLCLRFINWPQVYLQKIIPYIDCFSFTPIFNPEYARDYELIITFSEKLSANDRATLLRTYDLILKIAHEQLTEMLAQKFINVVECYGMNAVGDLYNSLTRDQYKLSLVTDFSGRKSIIDEMPVVSAQLCYYLIYPEQQLLSSLKDPCFPPLKSANKVSLLNFMTAFQFDDRILDLVNDPKEFIKAVNEWGEFADKSHPLRLLHHAIYHQADPNKHLYERELLQNALDAYAAASMSGGEAHIPIHLYKEGDHCVFRMQNKVTGMSLKDIFYYFALIGTSSKREDKHRHFIGGHGVGVFTAYHEAELIRLKSGKNDGEIYCFEFKPIYNNNKIVDIEITWDKVPGYFDGVIIERVDRGNRPTLTASRHHRTFKMHARTVNDAIAKITLNDKDVNHDLKMISSIDIPKFGQMSLYQSVEDMLTAGGLSVRPLNDIDRFIPEDIRECVRRNGLIIDLPKQIPLNRERTEVIDADHVYEFLRPYLLNAYIDGYVRLFMNNHISLTELPYDFFEQINRYMKDMETLNPELVQDAENIKNNKPLNNYQKYQKLSNLHELMAYLPLFKVRKELGQSTMGEDKQKAYSLIDLAHYYVEHNKFPELVMVPLCLNHLAKEYESSLASKKYQQDFALTIDNFPELDWIPSYLVNAHEWQALLEISDYIAKCMGFNNMQFGFSTARFGDLLHTRRDSKAIYWNVYSLAHDEYSFYKLFRDLAEDRRPTLSGWHWFLDSISHEIVHAQLEESCSSTHNRSFDLKQRQILVDLSKNFRLEIMVNKLKEIIQKYLVKDKNVFLFDGKSFIQTQFMDQYKNLSMFSLFPQKDKPDANDNVTTNSMAPGLNGTSTSH